MCSVWQVHCIIGLAKFGLLFFAVVVTVCVQTISTGASGIIGSEWYQHSGVPEVIFLFIKGVIEVIYEKSMVNLKHMYFHKFQIYHNNLVF